jgi:putative nucleotidyltransferase with HDIG domain
MEADVERRWEEWIHSGDWASADEATIPMLPGHVRELIQLALDPDVPAKRIASVVANDPVLAMQVIRMANSAFSAPAIRITSIDEAVVRLGTQAVRNVVIAGCLSAQLADPRIYGRRGADVVDHCIGTAFLASRLAERYGTSGELFLSGLLHDIGKLLILKLAHEYRQRSPHGPTDEEVETVIAERHSQMGGWLAGRWDMPGSIADPIVWHHDPAWAEARTPVAVVYAANRLAHRYGFGCDADASDLLEDPIVREVGVDAARLAQLDAAAPAMYDAARHVVRM